MHNISNKFILSKQIGCYRTYLRSISEKEYSINGNIEYIYVLKGNIFIEENNRRTLLNTKDIYIIGPWKDVIIDGEEHNIILVLQIMPDSFRELNLFKFKYIYTGLVPSEKVRANVASNMRILLKHRLKDRYTDDIILSSLTNLVNEVKIDFDLEFVEKEGEHADIRDIIVSITRELPSRIMNNEDTKLKTISEEYNVSYYYLSKTFKEVTGVTYSNYVGNMQMNIFLDLLINEDINITNMALKSGYKNICNLNKDFKKHFNMSPTELRKKYREDPIYNIKEVKDFLEKVDILEGLFLNEEIVIDLRAENQFTDRTMGLEDITKSIVRLKEFIGSFENIKLRVIINFSDYHHVLSLRDEKLLLYLSNEVRQVIEVCMEKNLELSVDYKM